MRKSGAPRRSSAFENLFAERQVYLRSGLTSRYVVLSRPLQIAVTISLGLIVAGLAFAAYSSVVSHLEADQLRRELALAEACVGELSPARVDGPAIAADRTAPADAPADPAPAQLAGSHGSAGQRIAELTRRLEAADARADRLQGDLDAALADAAALRRAAEEAEADLAALQTAMARRERPPAEGEASEHLAQIKESGTPEADAVLALEASLAGSDAQIAARADPGDHEGAPDAAGAAASSADELDRVRAELRAAHRRIAELEAAIRLSLAKLAPQPAPPAPR